MNSVEKLLQTLCPHGVEFRKLGEVGEILRGERIVKTNLSDKFQYPVISGGSNIMGFWKNFNRNENTITIAQYGTAGFVNFINEKFWANDVCYSLFPKKELQNKFLYYFLLAKQKEIYKLCTNAVPKHLPKEELSNLLVPLPPLEVQREIVKILDTFTQLNTELNTELKLRKKQYEYYRNWLLSFSDVDASKEGAEQRLRDKSYPKALKALLLSLCPYGVEFRKLGEVINICKGKQLNKEFLSNYGEYPVMNGGIYASGYWNTYNTNSPKIIISQGGASAGYVNYMTSKFWAGAHCYVIESDSKKVNYKFLFYFLKNKESFLIKSQFGAGIPALNKADIETLPIPLPPLEVQREIVKTLDDFSTLTEDLSSGIPAEIAVRKKQYEYYRDKLLTFTPLIKEGE
ncbi:type I R-M system S protein [Helicobacter mustelae]|uniref:restriction endonuclease subunit S n=1 Tax=Helicobacter mustelae TaxID=217 RepID=UPI000E02B6FF|nr:restriction endonuclease subunit S [Helicobacter mustelae]STP13270.1 type I R-M system S protein [Helicobacter mustelae]